jgi:Protein of unknown function VcgC/VcgE (DUF2780)
MRILTLFIALPVAVASAQDPPATTPPTSTVAAPAEKTVDQTASPELVGELVKELVITPSQAQSGAGTLFGVAKNRLSAADFAKVAGAVPNMEGLLAAAPAAGSKSAIEALAGQAGGVGSMAAAASTLSKLGLKPDTIAKFAPTLIKAVQSKGGAEVGKLLAGALK